MKGFYGAMGRRVFKSSRVGLATALVIGASLLTTLTGQLPASGAGVAPIQEYAAVLQGQGFDIPVLPAGGQSFLQVSYGVTPPNPSVLVTLAQANRSAGTGVLAGSTSLPSGSSFTVVFNYTNSQNQQGTTTYTIDVYACDSWTTANYREVDNLQTNSGSTRISSPFYQFTSADVGQTIISPDIPANDTIASLAVGGANLATAAITTGSGQIAELGAGTDNATTISTNPAAATFQTGTQSAYGAPITNGVHPGEWLSPNCSNAATPPVNYSFEVMANPFASVVAPALQSTEEDLKISNVHGLSLGTGIFFPLTWANGGSVPGGWSAGGDTQTACPPSQAAVNAGLVDCSMTAGWSLQPGLWTYTSDNFLVDGQPLPQTTTFSLNATSVGAGGTVSVTGGSNWWGSAGGTNIVGTGDMQAGSFYSVPPPDVYIGTTRASAVPATSSGVQVSPTTYACSGSVNNPDPCTFTPGTPSGSFTVPSSLTPGDYNVYIDESNTTPLMGNGPNDTYTNAANSSCVVGAAPSLGCNGTDEAVGTITVTGPPSITSPNNATVTEGTGALHFTINTTGKPTPSLSETGNPLPTGISFTDNGDGTATLAGTAALGTAGTYNFTVQATNGLPPAASQSFTLTVTPDASLSLTTSSFTSAFGAAGDEIAYSYLVTNTGATPVTGVIVTDDHATSVSCPLSSLNPGGSETCSGRYSVSQADLDAGSVTDTAVASAVAGAGSWPVTSNSSSTAVPKASAPSKPVFTSAASATITAGEPFTFTVSASGYPQPTLAAPTTDGVSLTADGGGTATLAGTPLKGGVVTIHLTAKNTKGSATQSFLLTVLAPPAFASPTSKLVVTGTPFSVTVKTKGYPAPSVTETAALPSGVTFTDNGNGTATIQGTVPTGDYGVYQLLFTATNGIGLPATQTLKLTADEPPTITSGSSVSVERGVAMTPFAITTTGYPTPAVVATGLPKGLSIRTVNGAKYLEGTPATTDTLGAYSVSISAKNAKGVVSQAFALTLTS